MSTTDQVTRLLAPDPGEETPQDDGISPIMPFPTSYVLDRVQEAELVDHAMTRLDELEREIGRDIAGTGDWWSSNAIKAYNPEGTEAPQDTWLGKRLLFDKTFKNEMDWRPALLGGIFKHSNLVVPIARRICRQMVARAINYFFGTTPWYSVYPVGIMDKDRADKADRYIRWKTDQSKLQRIEEQAVERAFVLGEAVAKTTWKRKEMIGKTKATVLVDEGGKDILGADGDYITEADLWVQDASVDEATGQPITTDLMILKRDGKTVQPAAMIWQEKNITRRIVQYRGPESKVVHYMDFLCPLEAETVQDADCIVHLYDRSLMDIADEWMKSIPAEASADERMRLKREAVSVLRELAYSTHETDTAQNSDVVDQSSTAGSVRERRVPMVKIAEFHLRYDADGDGIQEEIFLVVDRKTRIPIFYDYTMNVTPDGSRPYSVVRVNEIPSRWYGMGAIEMMNPNQQIIDLWMNRKNRSVSGSGRVDLFNPYNTIEGRSNPNLEMNWGGTYTPATGKKAEDIIQSVYLEDSIGEKLMEMIEFVMQLMMNESGVMSANDSNVAGLDSTKLATGIRNIERNGQELFSLFLGHLDPGVSDMLSKHVKLIMVNLDTMEVYRYFEDGEGGEGAGEFRQIDPGDIANLEIDTRILMTRHRGEQVLESNIRSVQVVKDYYAQPYEVQIQTKDMFIDILKALQIQNANKIIVPLQIMPPTTEGMPNASETAAATAPRPRQGAPNF
jgi:hypothetical protein